LIVADVLGIVFAFAGAWLLGDSPLLFGDATWEPFALLAGGIAVWVAGASAGGMYRDRPAGLRSLGADIVDLSGAFTVAVWAICVASWLSGKPDPDVHQLVAFWSLAIVAIALLRQVARIGGAGSVTKRRPSCWVPALALTDAVVLLAVLPACALLVTEPVPADNHAWAAVFIVLGISAWVAAATALGHYAWASVREDVLSTLVLASWGAWVLVGISPYTGEIDPDIPQVVVVWTVSIVGVVTARRVVRSRRSARIRA
jgi:hypothetical protein